MEIRNALQKIENYLTVVANLNKTILLEGTMSREELLLMKKYLYSSIDRIEDIESLLVLDNKDEKSFDPTENVVEYKKPVVTENEIVEIHESKNIEEVEATLDTEIKEEVIAALEEIKDEEEHKIEEVNEIKSEEEKVEVGTIEVPIISEIKKEITEPIVELKVDIVEPVIEAKVEIVEPVTEVVEEPAIEVKAEEIVEPILETKKEETLGFPLVSEVSAKEHVLVNVVPPAIPLVEKIEKPEPTFLEQLQQKIEAASETINNKFEEVKESSFVEQLKENYDITKTQIVDAVNDKFEKLNEEKTEEKKVDQVSFFEQMEQKLEKEQKPLFSLFDDGKDELHETYSKKTTNDFSTISDIFSTKNEVKENVLVAEKEVKPVVEQLTPSSISDIFKPNIIITENNTSTKTLSESIALNDKFIFVRELFGNQFNEYDNALRILEKITSFDEADKYCKDNFWNKFNWSERTAATERFKEILHKRFN
jgi:hypothetical protein